MLRIRLARRGKKRAPSYRVVVADVRSKRDGRFVEQIGFYDPMTDPITYKVKEGRALHWLSVGAQPSDAVRRLLDKQGTMERLARLRAGEEMGKLVAEFEGTPWPPIEEASEPEEAGVVETVTEAVADAAEAVQEVAEDAVEAVQDAAEAVTETVSDAVEAVQEAVSGDDSAESEEEA